MRVLYKAAAAVGFTVLLSGCVILDGPRYGTSSPQSFLSYAANGRDFRVVVTGNPFAQSDTEVAKAVTDRLQRQFSYLKTNFTTTPGSTELPPYKIVFAFNPPATMSGDKICADPAAVPSAPSGDKLRIVGVFCESYAMTEVGARVPATRSLADRDVQSALDQIVLAFTKNPEERRPFITISE